MLRSASAGDRGTLRRRGCLALCLPLIACVGRDRTRLVLNSFDSTSGPLPDNYWWSRAYGNNGSISLEYVATPNVQGNGAMRVSYEPVQVETWGGFVEFGHMSNKSYSLVGASHICLWYYIEQRSFAPERCHMRLTLLDGSDCGEGCDAEYGVGLENYYSFHHILDQGPGWHQLTVPLKGSASLDAPFRLTGWTGIQGNEVLDLNAIRGFIIEFSMDGAGQMGSSSNGILLLDGLECVGDGLLSSSFNFDPTVVFKDHLWWSQDDANNVSVSNSPSSLSTVSVWSFVNESECPHSAALAGNFTADAAASPIVQIGHILPGVAYYNLSEVHQISFQVRIAPDMKVNLRFVLLSASDCPRSCAQIPGHTLQSFHTHQHVLEDAKWNKIHATLPGSFEQAVPTLEKTGNAVADDHLLDRSFFKGFRFDMSIVQANPDNSTATASFMVAGLQGTACDATRLTLSSFDTSAGSLPLDYWYSRVYNTGSISFEHVDSPAVQGNGAMRISYEIVQEETWGGFVSIGHISNTSYSLAGASHISLWYNILERASAPGRAHMRLILFEASHCEGEGSCDTEFGQSMENYYSFHQVLDQEPGWHKITVQLEGSDDPSAPFLHTGWAGVAGNRKMDLHAIRGFKIEFSIDGSGALGSTTSGVLLLDGLECTGEHVLSSAFQVPSWPRALVERIWLHHEPGNESAMLVNLNVVNESEDSGPSLLHLNYTLQQNMVSRGQVVLDHLLPPGAYYNLSGAEEISFQVLHLQAGEVTATNTNVQLVLVHGHSCNSSCTDVEKGQDLFFSPECKLGEGACWQQVNARLEGADSLDQPSGSSGNHHLVKQVVSGFRLLFSVERAQILQDNALIGSIYFGDFSAPGVVIGPAQDELSMIAFEDMLVFDFWGNTNQLTKNEPDYFSFVATKEACGKLCLGMPSCIYFSLRLPSSQGNCALSSQLEGHRIFDPIGIRDDQSSSTSYASGWVSGRRPDACGDSGVCSCTGASVTCSSRNISIMPVLGLETRAKVKSMSLEGSKVAVLTRTLLGHLPVLKSLRLGNAVSFMTLDALQEAPQVNELTTDRGLGTMIPAEGTQPFSDICCGLDRSLQIGSASFFACDREAKQSTRQETGCDYEEFVFYSEEFVGAPILDIIKESNKFFGWAASSASSCCDLCKMIRGCTHFVQDERWSNTENFCILRNSDSGRVVEKEDREDYSCPDRGDRPFCLSLSLDKMGPGYISGYTPEQRVAYGNISLQTSASRAHLSKVNHYTFSYSVSVLGKIRHGAVWITPLVADSWHNVIFEPSRLVFYQGGLTSQSITVRCETPPMVEKLDFWIRHEAHGCDEAWGFLSKAQAHAIWVSAMPAQCPPGEFLNEDGSACEPCPAGSRRDDGNERCDPCPAGRASKERSLECTLCPPGRVSLGMGAFTSQTGSSECMYCQRGSYAGTSGMSLCEPCSIGRFASEEGQTGCKDCPQNVTNVATVVLGAHTEASCVCPKGFVFDGLICAPCPDMGIECPGGHSVLNLSLDETPYLKEGFMSLMSAPLAPYTCGPPRDLRCPGSRSPYRPEDVCGNGFKLIAQCGLCKEGWYRTVSRCEKCEASHVGPGMILKMGLTLLGQFVLIGYMFVRWNRPNPSGLIMIGSVFTFVQILHMLLQMQIDWPNQFSGLMEVIDLLLTPRGLLLLLQIQEECVFGSSVLWQVIIDVIVPLTPCLHLILLYSVGRWVSWHRARFDYVVNTLGLVFKSVFVSISAFTLQLFVVETMPNKKSMVRGTPGLEFGTEEWMQLLPFGIFACLVYCVGFLALVSHAVWVLPRRAGEDPSFLVRYRFAFGPLRPGAFWWILVQLAYNLGITVIKTLWSSAFLQIYLSTVLLLVVMAIALRVQPIKFDRNNRVEAFLNCSLLIFLILATSFISTKDVSEEEIQLNTDRNSFIIAIALSLGLLHAFVVFVKWAFEQLLPQAVVHGVHARVALQFRDVVASLGLMSNKEFLRVVNQLGEKDLQALEKQMQTLIPIFLHQQPGPSFFQHRVILNAPYKVCNRHETTARAIEAVINGEEHEVAVANAKSRLALIKLAGELREKTHIDEKSQALDAWHAPTSCCSKTATQSLAECLGLTPSTSLGLRDFCEHIGPLAPSLSEGELQLAFLLVDCNSNGQVSVDEFVAMLIAAAPHFEIEYQERFKQLENSLHKAESESAYVFGRRRNVSSPRTIAKNAASDIVQSLYPSFPSMSSSGLPVVRVNNLKESSTTSVQDSTTNSAGIGASAAEHVGNGSGDEVQIAPVPPVTYLGSDGLPDFNESMNSVPKDVPYEYAPEDEKKIVNI